MLNVISYHTHLEYFYYWTICSTERYKAIEHKCDPWQMGNESPQFREHGLRFSRVTALLKEEGCSCWSHEVLLWRVVLWRGGEASRALLLSGSSYLSRHLSAVWCASFLCEERLVGKLQVEQSSELTEGWDLRITYILYAQSGKISLNAVLMKTLEG